MESLKHFVDTGFFANIFFAIGIRFLFLLIILKAIHILMRFIANKFMVMSDNPKQKKQVHTIISTLLSFIDIVIISLFVIEILSKCGIDIRPILTAAGVLGVSVGLGSKQLIEDILSGISLILSGQILVGDIIEIDGKLGIVEKLNLKMVILRDWDGKVYYIRNGKIDIVTNYTREYAFAIIEIPIAYKENADNVMKMVADVVNKELHNGPCAGYILDDLEVWGIDSFGDSSINLKFRIKTKTMYQWKVRREFNRLIKNKFDELGIEIPFPQRTVHIEKDKQIEKLIKDKN